MIASNTNDDNLGERVSRPAFAIFLLGLVVMILGLLYAPSNGCLSPTIEALTNAALTVGTVIAFGASIGIAYIIRKRGVVLSSLIVLLAGLVLFYVWAYHGFLMGLCGSFSL